ncbi:MAG: formyltransferase family protein [Alphaproteobacteria bacterium]
MRFAVIGRNETLFAAAEHMAAQGHEIGLVVTAKAAPEYTKTVEDYRALAERHHAPFFVTPRIHDIAVSLAEMPPLTVALSMNYTSLIPQSIIDWFPLGILNAHGGDLPRYRGNACQAWAILNGEDKIGLCIHRMIGGALDSGAIIARDYYPLQPATTITQVYAWLYQRIPLLFVDAVTALMQDAGFSLTQQSPEPADALRCYPLRPDDGAIDWNQPAAMILRRINAFTHPYGGAYCRYAGEKLVIWAAAQVEDQERFLAVPGQVVSVGGDYVDVATGQGKLRLTQAAYRGVIVPPSQIIRSIRERLEHGRNV